MFSNKRILLTSRPENVPLASHFTKDDSEVIDQASLKDGQILVRTYYLSLDPYLIMPMGKAGVHGDVVPQNASLKLSQFKDAWNVTNLHELFGGRGVGRVLASKHSSVSVGDLVAADWKWQEYAIVDVNDELTFEKLERDIFNNHDNENHSAPLSNALGVLSVSGSHALYGFNFVKPREQVKGKTIVISAAAGNIGIIVGQVAKIHGMRVVGVAGGADKCHFLLNSLSYDAVVDYKKANNNLQLLIQQIREACPNGIDAYYDNVGGLITEAVDQNLNENARVYVCGAISTYASGGQVTITEKSAKIYEQKNIAAQTCMTADYITKIPEARRQLFEWMKEGKLKAVEWIVEGIENTPLAFEQMYQGKNLGKSIVKVFDEK
ncbi:hypothetical protein C9374_006879 [Naegleria lovaniensis]|uniref:Uncharacterized protein n=1 Tax=Naegleria lovaniensis TaxID=51637 RepID=A0AA88GYG1_NAELO|nr:uncharacterized protein C9374_006879 [Naegleria lovaniensis]KAG2393348.1 hypothetical protein C9374_006879 [Naegleria lovaniensis]